MNKLLISLFAATALTANAADQVTTNKVWLSGCTHIFARMSYSVTSASQYGICYSSTNAEPTVDDNTCRTYLSNNGNIYNISNLEPATVYYIRAYVKKTNGTVVYGEPVKAITRPKVNGVRYVDNGGWPDDATHTRVINAATEGTTLWNEYTGINGLTLTLNYGSGTATADCSYGGWMRIGPNSAYQATGTILHEALHAVGVGTHSVWNSSLMRNSSNYWMGRRATRAVRFWDNDNSAYLKGDGTHMWPYGVNGAHEDTKTQVLYIGNSVICEALGEDGLPPTDGQFATPGYVFEQNDTTKYYLKNEGYNSTSRYLSENNGKLAWTEMSDADAAADDAAAWYITFDPATCYYSLQNAKTKKYVSMTSGSVATKAVTTLTANEKLHLLPSPVDVAVVNGETKYGYWIGYPNNGTMSPLNVTSASATSASVTSLSFSATATGQRWLILTAEEAKAYGSAEFEKTKDHYDEYVTALEALLKVPYGEITAGTHATFETAVAGLRATVDAATKESDFSKIESTGNKALYFFLKGIYATDDTQPFDLTFRVANASLEDTEGWTATAEPSNISYSCMEYYQKSFNLSQKITFMANGKWEMKVQGFERPGTTATVAEDWTNGDDNATAYIYLGSTGNKKNVCNIMADAQAKKVGKGTEVAAGSTGKYVPNNMQAAAAYFDKGYYENTLTYGPVSSLSQLTLGINGSRTTSSNWSIWSNLRLYYYGNQPTTGITGIEDQQQANPADGKIYTINGQYVGDDIEALPTGIYIVGGKKVMK